MVENKSYVPDVLIEGCIFRNNRARRAISECAGKVVVRNNRFQTPGAAVLIEGDSNYCSNQEPQEIFLLKKTSLITALMSAAGGWRRFRYLQVPLFGEEGKRYHRYLEIRRNIFRCFDDRLLNVTNLETLIFRDNKVEKTDMFPPIEGKPFELNGVLRFETDYQSEGEENE